MVLNSGMLHEFVLHYVRWYVFQESGLYANKPLLGLGQIVHTNYVSHAQVDVKY